jgi:hypothetical protein
MARLVPQPGQKTSSHGVPASSAARIVGDHNMSRTAASCSFQRSIRVASARGFVGGEPGGAGFDVEPSCTYPHGRSIGHLARRSRSQVERLL